MVWVIKITVNSAMTLLRLMTLSLLSCFLISACHFDKNTTMSDDFASANIGKPDVAKISNKQANIQLDNDNHNAMLDVFPLWRNW
ncbi:hypothetical protein SOPP22_03195 [Shewanella sp. OPT22]|nr:hypothetical protein SOPP22_03195 [Shewanella sp. OPT22]